ncbi:MBL fold metallo-hydrolase [Micromonospora sp. U56]|nr:MBL fold metallo-hydrolase [Micromonospora sp. U56]
MGRFPPVSADGGATGRGLVAYDRSRRPSVDGRSKRDPAIAEPAFHHLAGRVWLHPGDPDPGTIQPSVALITDERGGVLVDVGHSPGHARKIRAALTAAGLPEPRWLVYTHHHWDHVWGACVTSAAGTPPTRPWCWCPTRRCCCSATASTRPRCTCARTGTAPTWRWCAGCSTTTTTGTSPGTPTR